MRRAEPIKVPRQGHAVPVHAHKHGIACKTDAEGSNTFFQAKTLSVHACSSQIPGQERIVTEMHKTYTIGILF